MNDSLRTGFYFPLTDFNFDGDEYRIDAHTLVLPQTLVNKFKSVEYNLENELGKKDFIDAIKPKHCLFIELPYNSDEDAQNKAALFLWTLWLVSSSTAVIKQQFYFSEEHFNSKRWRTIYKHTFPTQSQKMSIDLLSKVKAIFPKACEIYSNKLALKRLSESLYLSHLGCEQRAWQASFILWMTSIETLLLEPTNKGITDTVCSRAARLIADAKDKHDEIYNDMNKLYDIRSDIVHGRFDFRTWDSGIPNERLDTLSKIEKINKLVWNKVFSLQNFETQLEHSKDRKTFFDRLPKY